MNTLIIISSSCLVVIVLCFTLRGYAHGAQHAVTRIEHLKFWRDEFFDCIEPLLSDSETPLDLIEMIEVSVRHIDNPRAAWVLYRYFLKRALKPSLRYPSEKDQLDIFFERREELKEPFLRYLRSFVIAVSFNDEKLGPRMRSLFAEILADPNRKAAAAVTAEIIKHSYDSCDNNNNNLVPA